MENYAKMFLKKFFEHKAEVDVRKWMRGERF